MKPTTLGLELMSLPVPLSTRRRKQEVPRRQVKSPNLRQKNGEGIFVGEHERAVMQAWGLGAYSFCFHDYGHTFPRPSGTDFES